MSAAAAASRSNDASLYALTTRTPRSACRRDLRAVETVQSSVMLVSSSRRICPVPAMRLAMASLTRISSAALSGQEPGPNSTRMCCRSSSSVSWRQMVVVSACTDSIKSVSISAVTVQFSTGRLMKPSAEQLKPGLLPNVYCVNTLLSTPTLSAHSLLRARISAVDASICRQLQMRRLEVPQNPVPSSTMRVNVVHCSRTGWPPSDVKPK
mmetsp:Transcript_31614/g.95001  ORF Transcript_31614/g.95001 Transcript_31614/m.95001 type:complete len:210 (-) Transcript_31614:2179-2808(-)